MRVPTLLTSVAGVAVTLAISLTSVAYAQAGQASVSAPPVPAGQVLYFFNTGLVLTAGQQAKAGATVRVAQVAGRSGQSWILTSQGHLSPASNQKLCLDVATIKKGKYRLDLRQCDGSGSERFVLSAPSAHTPVLFIEPRARKSLCVGAPTKVEFFGTSLQTSTVGVSQCANDQDQAWSTSNLENVVGQFGRGFASDLFVPGSGEPGGLASLKFPGNSLGEIWTLTEGLTGMTFSPVENTSSCLTTRGLGRQLILSQCDGTRAQNILPIPIRPTTSVITYVLGVDTAQHCLVKGTRTRGRPTPVVVGACPDTAFARATGIWFTGAPAEYNDQIPSIAADFEGFYDEPDQFGNEYGMTVRHTSSGSAVTLAQVTTGIAQTWTDLRPGRTTTANPDGSISIRPLINLTVCLTVPAGKDQAGTLLQVQTCDGAKDQEFSATIPSVNGLSGPAVFSPFADQGLCLAPRTGVTKGSSIGLETCPAQQTLSQDDTWQGFGSWDSWVSPTR